MSSIEPLSPFHAAVAAFEIRFEMELATCWQRLESEAAGAIEVPSKSKSSVLFRFFEDAGEAIGVVVHEYFPKLLQVAAIQRRHLGSASPLSWTKAQVLRQACTFLGIDEKFDHTAAPRGDSRLLAAAERIALGRGWLEDAVSQDFVLPGWVDSRRIAWLTFGRAEDDREESLLPLSRAKTLEWIKQKEFWISRKLEHQIDNDGWDGVIEAGKLNISILDAFEAVDGPSIATQSTQLATDPRENRFVREGATWAISFDAETCRLKLMN